MQGSENPFMEEEEIQRSEERGSSTGVGSGWKEMNGRGRMDVQVDTEVEIQSSR
jgi:hypothetical protein